MVAGSRTSTNEEWVYGLSLNHHDSEAIVLARGNAMADHEPIIRSSGLEWIARCTCEPSTSLGSYFLNSSAAAAHEAHKTEVGVKPPKNHEIILREHLLSSGVSCACTCDPDDDLGSFSKVESAVLAWRKHSGK
jgi:hypothetical protein